MYQWVEHTAELELRIEAESDEGVFADALAAFAELAGGTGEGSESRTLALQADDPGLLLVDWLNELVYLADSEGFVPAEPSELAVEDGRLRAVVLGRAAEPRPLVKAVSLHGLHYARGPGGRCEATVVLDV